MNFVFKPLYMMKNHPFKDIYDTNYTLGYYSGFYRSLKDRIWANGGNFEFLSKDEERFTVIR